MFDYRAGSREQLWIAGGIGLTPFLSWIRDFDSEDRYSIDFFYSLRGPEEILYEDEILQAAAENKNFRPHYYLNQPGRETHGGENHGCQRPGGRERYLYLRPISDDHGAQEAG